MNNKGADQTARMAYGRKQFSHDGAHLLLGKFT